MIEAIKQPMSIAERQQALRLLVAENKMETAIQQLTHFSTEQNLTELQTLSLQQSAKLKEWSNHQIANTLNLDQLQIMKSQIVANVLQLINRLADVETRKAKYIPQKSVRESTLKLHLLILILVSKVILFIFLFTHWEAGGFTVDQFRGTLTLLIPVLASYSVLAIRDLFREQKTDEPIKYFKRKTLVWSYVLVIGYMLILMFAVSLKPQGSLSYAQMNGLITVFESSFGALIGQIIMDLFKKK